MMRREGGNPRQIVLNFETCFKEVDITDIPKEKGERKAFSVRPTLLE